MVNYLCILIDWNFNFEIQFSFSHIIYPICVFYYSIFMIQFQICSFKEALRYAIHLVENMISQGLSGTWIQMDSIFIEMISDKSRFGPKWFVQIQQFRGVNNSFQSFKGQKFQNIFFLVLQKTNKKIS